MKLNLTCNRFPVWQQGSFVAALILVLPIAAIFVTAFGESNQLFSHLFSTVMPTYTTNTILLVVNVMLLSLVLGVPTAWLMAMCQLPGGKILQWALVLPLAMPGYIIGYIYTDWFDYAGPVQIVLRQITGWEGEAIGSRIFARLVVPAWFFLWCFILMYI